MSSNKYKLYKEYLDKETKRLIMDKDIFHYSLNMIYRFKHYLKLLKHLIIKYSTDISFAILPDSRRIIFRIESLKNNKFFDFIICEDLVCIIIINNINKYKIKRSTTSSFIKEFDLLLNLFIGNKPNYFLDELKKFKDNIYYKNFLAEVRDIQQDYMPNLLTRVNSFLKNVLFELSFIEIIDDLYYNPLLKMYVQIISIDIYGTTIKNCTKSSKFYINYKVAYSDIENLKNKNIKSCELYDFCNQLELSCRQNVNRLENGL